MKSQISELSIESDDSNVRLKEMEKLITKAHEKFEIGETSVVISVSSPHRRAAFEACEWLIKELKRTVPIWKKEVYADGEVWVEGETS